MKKISGLAIALSLVALSGCATAQAPYHAPSVTHTTVPANVTHVQPLLTQVTDMTSEQICEVVSVPIYENRRSSASTGDVLLGAIVGGVIGNQFGGGSGKDAMTVLGAIVGADSVNKRSQSYDTVTGYRNQEQCRIVNRPVTRTVNQGYEVYYEWNGLNSSVITHTKYNVGDTILVRVSLN